ncbi:DUF4258 domain-containing protein [Rhodothermus marinus]|uniref:DUF4258 domain-containing protein n=1 Tax=Rhodothermus marinus TaxID=29549 RepID=UPI0012BA5046|nr:DUF4258 domain-containing protein [Rhodothermus marinus]BBM72054.1 hypothetical protein RmaAA338_09190 [Rhodothermus marinus]
MSAYECSEHAREMLRERNILEAWVKRVLEEPEITEWTLHYLRAIEEFDGRYLRVVVNPEAVPQRIVTVFFDRRLKRKER